jgi:hypothetical protein
MGNKTIKFEKAALQSCSSASCLWCLQIEMQRLPSHKQMFFIYQLAYFAGVARVFIYPNHILVGVPSLTEIKHLDGIFSIITSTLLGGTLPLFPRRCPGIFYPNLIAICVSSLPEIAHIDGIFSIITSTLL